MNTIKIRTHTHERRIISKVRECIWAEIQVKDKRITFEVVGDSIVVNFINNGKLIKNIPFSEMFNRIAPEK